MYMHSVWRLLSYLIAVHFLYLSLGLSLNTVTYNPSRHVVGVPQSEGCAVIHIIHNILGLVRPGF